MKMLISFVFLSLSLVSYGETEKNKLKETITECKEDYHDLSLERSELRCNGRLKGSHFRKCVRNQKKMGRKQFQCNKLVETYKKNFPKTKQEIELEKQSKRKQERVKGEQLRALKKEREKEALRKDKMANDEKKRLAKIKAEDSAIKKKLKKQGMKLEYVYHPEWKVYSTLGRSLTKVNSTGEWKLKRGPCKLGPVVRVGKTKFSRDVFCNGKRQGSLSCKAKKKKTTKCKKNFGLLSLYLTIKRYPSMGTRRAIEAEKARNNKNPY